ncbi:MAG TPA: peptidylprolyl isomerase [Acidimicrobiia bacterium]|nr:peptidylprolyl isomerase [Acidimicrobiia bacterium]
MSRVRRHAAVAAIVLLGAGLLSSCTGASSYAAIVNGSKISQATLLRELHSLGANAAFVTTYNAGVAQAAQQGQTSLSPVFASGTANKTYTQGFTAIVLNTDIQAALIHQEVVRRHLEPTPAVVAAATAGASQQFPNDANNQPVFPKFDPWFRSEYQQRQAESDALGKALGPVASDTAAIKTFFDQNPQDFITTECVSHILVGTQAEAVSIRKQVVGGAAFAAQARKYSTDTASAIKGGDLGCAAPGAYDPAFERVADTIAVNVLSQPVHSQFGWHLIKVRSRQMQPLDTTNSGRIQQFLKQESPVSAFMGPALKAAVVTVNPAYGTWDTVLHGVVAPIPPPAKAGAPTPSTAPPTAPQPGASVPTSPASTPAASTGGSTPTAGASTPTSAAGASTTPTSG